MSLEASWWFEAKTLAEHATGWPRDTLHVMGGVLLQLLFAFLLRTGLSDRRPWLVVLALELANEAYDLWIERWPSWSMQWGEGVRDLLGTMLLPTLLLIIARRRPRLLAGRR
jgi:hypothetical protein